MNIISCLNHCNNLQIHPPIFSWPSPIHFLHKSQRIIFKSLIESHAISHLNIFKWLYITLKMKSKLLTFSYKIPVEISSPLRLCMMDNFYLLLQIQISGWEQSDTRAFTHSITSLQLVVPAPFRWTTNYSTFS